MKKALALVLSTLMITTALVSCTKAPASSTPPASKPASAPASTPAENLTAEHVTIKIFFDGCTVTEEAAKPVLEKVNAILKDKINVTLAPIWGSWADFDDRVMASINGNDDVDIYFTSSWTPNAYNQFATKGTWVRLDDPANNLIEKYASNLWAKIPQALKDAALVPGSDGVGTYAIPMYKDMATQNCWDVNVDLLKKYGYTPDDIKAAGFYGFGPILEKIKAGEGKDFYPFIIEPAVLERMVTNSIIVTGDSGDLAHLSYYIDPTDITKAGVNGNKIVNKYATPEFEKFVKQMREYFLAGYIDPAFANVETANAKRTELQLAARYAIGTQSYALGCETEYSAQRKIEVAMVPVTDPYVDTTSAQGSLFAVSTTSKNPERAVMFLNEYNTNAELFTLLTYGIEGVQYNMVDGGVEFDAEARKSYSPWTNGMGCVALDVLPPLKGQPATFWKDFRTYYESAKSIAINGWAYDPSSLKTETGAVVAAGQQYHFPLMAGVVDPVTELPKLIKTLEDNGINKIVDEANKQLSDYLAAK